MAAHLECVDRVAELPLVEAAIAQSPGLYDRVMKSTEMAMEKAKVDSPAEPQSMPHLECVDRVAKLPLVEAAIAQSAGLYDRVKGSYGLVNWTLSTAEGAAKKAIDIATPIATPLAIKLQQPIHVMDQTLCKGLDVVESKMPIIKEQPQQILDNAKTQVSNAKAYSANKAHSLAELSWQKANEVLTTRYGNLAYQGFDTTAHTAEKYFDYYFPPTEAETETVVQEEDPNDRVSHTVHTVGRLSNKMARRVYNSVSTQVKSLDKDKVQEYIHSLIALLTLTTYINALQKATTEKKTPPEEPKTSTAIVPKPCTAIVQKS